MLSQSNKPSNLAIF